MMRLVTGLVALALSAAPAMAAWDPQAFAAEDTLEFLTVSPADGQHWSTVWLVVIDGQVTLGGVVSGTCACASNAPMSVAA